MISIVGNIKLDGNETRLKYFYACLRSYEFLKDDCQLILNIDCHNLLFDEIENEIVRMEFDYRCTNETGNYGVIYCELLKSVKYDYVINFFEDHFLILDSKEILQGILETMKLNNADVCKSSFFKVEQNSSRTLNYTFLNRYGKVFLNDEKNHKEYQQYYKSRFYIGVNFLTTLEFAKKFWSRKINSLRPHEYEVNRYNKELEHVCMIQNVEIQASIEDNHGQIGSCLLERNDERFWNIFNEINVTNATNSTTTV